MKADPLLPSRNLRATASGILLLASCSALAHGPMLSDGAAVVLLSGPAAVLGGIVGWLAARREVSLSAALLIGSICALLCVLLLFGGNAFGNLHPWQTLATLGAHTVLPFLAALWLLHWWVHVGPRRPR